MRVPAPIARLYAAVGGNVTQAARLAKRTRTDFYKLLARYRLQPHDFKNPGPPTSPRNTDADEDD